MKSDLAVCARIGLRRAINKDKRLAGEVKQRGEREARFRAEWASVDDDRGEEHGEIKLRCIRRSGAPKRCVEVPKTLQSYTTAGSPLKSS